MATKEKYDYEDKDEPRENLDDWLQDDELFGGGKDMLRNLHLDWDEELTWDELAVFPSTKLILPLLSPLTVTPENFVTRRATLSEWLNSNAISNEKKQQLLDFLILDIKGKERYFSFLELEEILERLNYIRILDSSSLVVPSRFEPIVVSGMPHKPSRPLWRTFDYLKHLIKTRSNIPGKILAIDTFITWFSKNLVNDHKNCATVINKEEDLYGLWVAVYEDPCKNMEGILNIVWIRNYLDIDDANTACSLLRHNLNQDNPILFVSPTLRIIEDEKYLFINVVKIKLSSDVENNPDNYIRPLDIVSRPVKKIGFKIANHFAIYLGNKKVCHMDNNSSSSGSSGSSFSFSSSSGSEKTTKIEDWKDFFKQATKIVRYHSTIPFKHHKKIIEDIAKVVAINYGENKQGEGKYHLFKNNCEHLTDLCVYNLKLSAQFTQWRDWGENLLENTKRKTSFVINHPIRSLKGETPPIYYAKVDLESKMKESESLLNSLPSAPESTLEEIKKYGEKWTDEVKNEPQLGKDYETRIEVFQPPKEFIKN